MRIPPRNGMGYSHADEMSKREPEPAVRYEPNPKHREPWQRGRRGALCQPDTDPALAQQLLANSK